MGSRVFNRLRDAGLHLVRPESEWASYQVKVKPKLVDV